MALLQIFYHPLDDSTESLKSQVWTESTATFSAGKVSSGLFGAEAEFLGVPEANYITAPAAYDSAAAATKVAFAGWLRNPSA